MNKLCSIFFVLMMSLQLAAQAPDWYSAASRKAHYPQNDWYIGYVEGEQRENEDIEETFSRLKDDARAELASTIITTIKHSSRYHSQSDMRLGSDYFEENIQESIVTETEISSFINDIPEIRPEIYRIPKGKTIAAFASLKKSSVRNLYIRKIEESYASINESLVIIDYLMKNQERIKVGEELKKAKEDLTQSNEYYKWLLIFGCNEDKINVLLSQRTEIEHKIRKKISFLSLYTESICILCGGAAYDFSCSQIVDKIKGNMSELSCSFTDDPSQADWIINFRLKAETDNTRSNSKEQFVKVSITGSAYCVNKKTTYPLYSEEYDSALSSPKAAEVILRRGKLINGITNDIINILKSK